LGIFILNPCLYVLKMTTFVKTNEIMKKIFISIIVYIAFSYNSQSQTSIATLTAPITCSQNGSAVIFTSFGTPPYIYAISNDGVNFQSPQTVNTFTNLVAGTYTFRVTDSANLVETTNSLVLSAYIPLVANATFITTNSILISATGGVQPYEYFVNGVANLGSQNNYFENLPPGTYAFSVKDSNGCTFQISQNIQVSALQMSAIITNPSCYGESTGSVTATVSGGLAPFTYTVNASGKDIATSQNSTFSNLAPGTYSLSVTDSLGSSYFLSFTVSQPSPIVATYSIVNNDIVVNATGGTPPYIYSINSSSFTPTNTFASLPVGVYNIQVKDINGCVTSLNSVINVAPPQVNNSTSTTINFSNQGATLADIAIQGNDVKWYANDGSVSLSRKSKKSSLQDTPLPLSTILQNNTTYYASQTINGFESQQRSAITVTIGSQLSNNSNAFESLNYFPNPTKNNFTVSNEKFKIQEISVMDISGKNLVYNIINDFKAEVDLTNLNAGIYFMRIKADGSEKVLKIFKE
jgi:Secretion system C-terminal sorting domain/SprB repeat